MTRAYFGLGPPGRSVQDTPAVLAHLAHTTPRAFAIHAFPGSSGVEYRKFLRLKGLKMEPVCRIEQLPSNPQHWTLLLVLVSATCIRNLQNPFDCCQLIGRGNREIGFNLVEVLRRKTRCRSEFALRQALFHSPKPNPFTGGLRLDSASFSVTRNALVGRPLDLDFTLCNTQQC